MFRSNEETTCVGCGSPIHIGDAVSWSRKSTGKYHPTCHPSRIRVVYAPLPVAAPITATPIPQEIVAPTVIETRPTLEEISQGYVQKPLPSVVPSSVVPSAVATADEVYTLPAFKELSQTAPWWDVLAQCTRVLDRILLVGPPSSGKSTTGMKTLGIKHRITMTQSTSREDMCGMFHLIQGETKWIDGPVTKAMRNGQPVLIDEIDRCGPEVESLMYSVIDDKPHLSLPNGELVQAVSGFKVIMTSNVSPDALEEAVRDRMQAILLAYVPHIDALAGLSATEKLLVQNYYRTLTQPRLTLPPTVRRMRAFKTLTDAKIPARIAMTSVFGAAAMSEIQSVVANLEAVSTIDAKVGY